MGHRLGGVKNRALRSKIGEVPGIEIELASDKVEALELAR